MTEDRGLSRSSIVNNKKENLYVPLTTKEYESTQKSEGIGEDIYRKHYNKISNKMPK